MISLGDIIVHFLGDDQQLTDVMDRAEQRSRTVGDVIGRVFENAAGVALGGAILGGFRAIGDALLSIPQQAFGAISSFEQMRASINALTAKEYLKANIADSFTEALQVAKPAAEETIKWMEKLAIQSPFNASDVQAAYQLAQSYGFLGTAARSVEEAQQKGLVTAQRLTQSMLNYVAATGQSPATMERVAMALGQMSTAGKVMAGDLNQLTSAGISAKQILADEFAGGSVAKLQEMIQAGLIPADQAVLAIVKDMELMGGAAKEASNTWGGLTASLQDIASFAWRDLFTPALDALRPVMIGIVEALQGSAVQGAIQELGQRFGNVATQIVSTFGPAMAYVQRLWQDWQPAIDTAINLISQFGGILADLGSQAFAWGQNLINQFAIGIADAAGAVADALGGIGDLVTFWLQPGSPPRLLPDIDQWGKEAAQVYLDAWGTADLKGLNTLSEAVSNVLNVNGQSGAMAREQGLLAQAVDQMRTAGKISVETYDQIRQAAGTAGDQVVATVEAYTAQIKATNDLQEAQATLERTSGDLTEASSALNAAQSTGDQDAIAAARIRLQQITAERSAAQAKARAAKAEQSQAQQQVDRQTELLNLMKRQLDMMDKKGKGGGGGGGKETDQEAQKLARLTKAQRDYAFATADTAGQIRMLEEEVSKLADTDPEYYQKKLQLDQLRERQAKEQTKTMEDTARQQQRLADAAWDYEFATASTEKKLAMLNERQAKLNPQSEDYYKNMLRIRQVEDQLAREREAEAKKEEGRTKKAGGRKASGKAGGLPKAGSAKGTPGAAIRDAATGVVNDVKQRIEEKKAEMIADMQRSVIDLRTRLNNFLSNLIQPETPGKILTGLGTILGTVITWVGERVPAVISAFHAWSIAALMWVQEAWPGVMQGLGTLGANVITAIGQTLPGIIASLRNWSMALIAWITVYGPDMLAAFGSMVGQLLDAIGANLPGIVQALAQWGQALTNWVIAHGPDLMRELGNLLLQVRGWISERAPAIREQIDQWGVMFVTWVATTTPQLIFALGTLLGEFLGWIISQVPLLDQFLTGWITVFMVWPQKIWDGLVGYLESFLNQVGTWISQAGVNLGNNTSLGTAMVNGIRKGISDLWGGLVNWFKDKVKSLLAAGQDALDSHSPSEEARKRLGRPVPQGMRLGLNDEMPNLLDTMRGNVSKVIQAGKNAVEPIIAPFGVGGTNSGGLLGQLETVIRTMTPASSGITFTGDVQINDPVDLEIFLQRVKATLVRQMSQS